MKINNANRIIIGTAQFGLNYGVTNSSGVVPQIEVFNILDYACSKGVTRVDTASMYGHSEQLLGQYKRHQLNVITKLPKLNDSLSREGFESSIRDALTSSLNRLQTKKISGLLVHDTNDFFKYPREFEKIATDLKREGFIDRFGVSLYTPEQALAVLDVFNPDIIQFPLNIFDQRFLQSGVLATLKERGIECHVRSVFLQGIILQNSNDLDPFFSFFKDHYMAYESYIKKANMNYLEAALKFVLDDSRIDQILLGVCSLEQFRAITDAIEKLENKESLRFDQWKFHDDRLINPLSWPMLKR